MSPKKASKKVPAKARAAAQRGEHAPADPTGLRPRTDAGGESQEDVGDEVFEFVRAIDAYKRAHQRPFPSWSEVLEVLKGLGYERRSA